MDDPLRMGVGEGVGHGGRQGDCLARRPEVRLRRCRGGWWRVRSQPGIQRRALDPLHGIVVSTAVAARTVDLDDVSVPQAPGGARFAAKAGDSVRAADAVVGQHLDRDLAIEGSLPGRIHRAHAPAAEFVEQPEVAEHLLVPRVRRSGASEHWAQQVLQIRVLREQFLPIGHAGRRSGQQQLQGTFESLACSK